MLLTVLELISQRSNFARITILRNGVFSPLFSKYVLVVWNKLCPSIKWLIFRRVWRRLMLLTVLELISQSSNFSRITTLRNGVFSPLFSKYVRHLAVMSPRTSLQECFLFVFQNHYALKRYCSNFNKKKCKSWREKQRFISFLCDSCWLVFLFVVC